MPGLIETYIHSDNSSPNKGGAMIELLTETDFSARTDDVQAFAKRCAKMAYAFKDDEGAFQAWFMACCIVESEKINEVIKLGRREAWSVSEVDCACGHRSC